ncbi:Membrane protein involved in the export of O-antigen and teichoic acid [Quadrisphaera granulorum]|uniref:O-antigen/teichoic acid export membrane protein n=1 Tax=Quadrisphaera granulorum TaxID=317664 RepID=A0A316AE42_9ACTN|nr:polysaccharide biosynthesis protein [Quadrisphaera granulorum]PWJ56046.1 O-antigen/teichoic acid export membrane protein [Quadrisphaera granulorum]SZE94680.1 Membrane protein involved in the export of O-antigen and teichoic acid [Quadrisphaera granulorum]
MTATAPSPASNPASTKPRGSSGAYRTVGRSAGSKLVVMALSGAISIVTIHLVISHFGVEAYAQYGLLVSVAALLPFADLGLASVVINAVSSSEDPDHDDAVRTSLVSAVRVILCSAAVITALGLGITLAGWWPALLGGGLMPGSGPVAALLCVVVFSATLPLAVGQRVLTALGLNHLQILTQGLASPLFAASVLVLVATGTNAGAYLAVFSYLGAAAIAATGCLLAARRLPTTARRVLRDVPRVRTVPSIPVVGLAWPVLVAMVAEALAMQTDRLLLSHLATTDELAEYNLSWSLASLLLQTISAAGIALWPVFARARARADVSSPFGLAWAFAGVAALAAGTLALLMPFASHLLSDGKIAISPWTAWAFAAFVVVQAAKYPLGMYLTDGRGLRAQVPAVLLMVVINLGISWALVGPMGAAGPVVGSVVAVLVCQVCYYTVLVRRDLARRRAELAAAAPASASASSD